MDEKDLQEKIAKAQKNPLYNTIHQIIEENDIANPNDVAEAIDNKLKGIADSSQLQEFFKENKDTFFNENNERIPFININNSNVKLGMNGNKTNSAGSGSVEAAAEQVTKEGTEAATEGAKQAVKEGAEEVAENVAENSTKVTSNLKKIFGSKGWGLAFNAGFAINDYFDARENGKGVIRSTARAAGLFVAGEVAGGWMLPIMLAKSAPQLITTGFETAQTSVRQMNSSTRLQTFGDAHFQDTQQLATMRQSGMELAKMSQYNLQQSIMGNEAQYMHTL